MLINFVALSEARSARSSGHGWLCVPPGQTPNCFLPGWLLCDPPASLSQVWAKPFAFESEPFWPGLLPQQLLKLPQRLSRICSVLPSQPCVTCTQAIPWRRENGGEPPGTRGPAVRWLLAQTCCRPQRARGCWMYGFYF